MAKYDAVEHLKSMDHLKRYVHLKIGGTSFATTSKLRAGFTPRSILFASVDIFSVAGKVVVVTGASRGIGLMMAKVGCSFYDDVGQH